LRELRDLGAQAGIFIEQFLPFLVFHLRRIQ
jgi:hypothetical protein